MLHACISLVKCAFYVRHQRRMLDVKSQTIIYHPLKPFLTKAPFDLEYIDFVFQILFEMTSWMISFQKGGEGTPVRVRNKSLRLV